MYNKVYEDKNFTMYIEEEQGEWFFHLDIVNFSRDVMIEILKQAAIVKAHAYWLGHEAVYFYTTNKKMFNLFPTFKDVGGFELNGKSYKVGQCLLH